MLNEFCLAFDFGLRDWTRIARAFRAAGDVAEVLSHKDGMERQKRRLRGRMIGKQKGRGANAAVREEQDMNPAQEKAPPGRNAGTRPGCTNNFDLLDKGGNGTLADGPDRADGRGTS